MQMIIKADLILDDGAIEGCTLVSFEREVAELSLRNLGLTLSDGKELLRRAQQCLATSQAAAWLKQRAVCACGWSYPHKDTRTISVRTVFGRVTLPSPRWYRCLCECPLFGRQSTWSPLPQVVPQRLTPELELLVVTAAAQQPYAQAVESLGAVLPLEDCISISGAKNRVRAVAAQLDQCPAEDSEASASKEQRRRLPGRVRSIAIDSVWLRHCSPTRSSARQVSIVVARALLADGSTKVCGYVTKQVPRSCGRMDGFLASLGVTAREKLTAVSDGAGEFETALGESRLAGQRIVDWFHIAMKFRAVQMTMLGMQGRDGGHNMALTLRVDRAKLRLWHGRARKALDLLETLPEMVSGLYAGDCSTLQRNLGKLVTYLQSNERHLVNYAQRYRQGLPISSAPAESAVNQLVSVRMAKQRQMRWSDEGAHALVQVRAAMLNGELSARRVPIPWYRKQPTSRGFDYEDSRLAN